MKNRFILPLLPFLALGGLTSCSKPTDYVVGICQFVPHEALDAATKGFKQGLSEELAKLNKTVKFVDGNCNGETSLCSVVIGTLLSKNVDLIMANATAPFVTAVNSTKTVPIVGTSITSYQEALQREEFDGVTGINATGTSDLAPLDRQAEMIFNVVGQENVKKIGLLYCSSEANSLFQIKEMEKNIQNYASAHSINVETRRFPFIETADVDQVTRSASAWSDVLYTPTDNQVANTANTIYAAAMKGNKRVPIICGEEGPCKKMGVATLTISYLDIGIEAGKMAAEILNGKDIKTMPIKYSTNPIAKYNEKICKENNIPIDERFDGYVPLV